MRIHLALLSLVTAITGTAVLELTVESFDAFIAAHELSLVSFVAPWCSFCQDLAPQFDLAAKLLEKDGLPIASVNCDEEQELCTRHKIPIYPTILLFQDSQPLVYDGRRKADAMASFLRRHNHPIISPLRSSKIADFTSKDNITVVGYFDEADEDSKSKFTKLAEKHRRSYLFGHTSDELYGQTENIGKPAISLYKSFDEGKNTLVGSYDIEKIETFFKENALPLVSDIGADLFHDALMTERPIAFVFAETVEERASLAAELKPIAEASKGHLVWVTVDPIAYSDRAQQLALQPGKWPAFGIDDNLNNFKFAFPQQGRMEYLKQENIQGVIDDFLAGGLEPSIKSEPIPATQSGAVVKVVAKSYEQLVTNATKDVLMLFHSPSCKHCKALAPSYKQVAELLSPLADKIMVAEIDATANDVSPAVDSYPTIKFFGSGPEKQSSLFSGNRTVYEIIKFVKDNGSAVIANLLGDITESIEKKSPHDEL